MMKQKEPIKGIEHVDRFFDAVKGTSAMILNVQFHNIAASGRKVERVSFRFRINGNEPKRYLIEDQLKQLTNLHFWDGCHVKWVRDSECEAVLRVDGLTDEIKSEIIKTATKSINRNQLEPDLENVEGFEDRIPTKSQLNILRILEEARAHIRDAGLN